MSTVSTEKGSPWHAGEVALQEKVGVAPKMQELGRRVIRDYLPDQHRAFYRQLPFIVAGAVADDGDVWATLVAGQPGFMQSPTEKVLHMAVAADPHDPASGGLHEGAAIGLLGIELHTRRRNRMNGLLRGATPHGFDVEVIQSFGH